MSGADEVPIGFPERNSSMPEMRGAISHRPMMSEDACGQPQDLLARMLTSQIIPRILDDTARGGPQPDDETRDALLRLSLRGDLTGARALLDDCLADGMRSQTVMQDLLAPVARSLGVAWEEDGCSFAAVTIAMGTLETLLRDLTETTLPAPRIKAGATALLSLAPGEQHSFGIRMVAETFLRAGWSITTTVRPTAAELRAMAATASYAVIGLSAGTDRNVETLAGLISGIRRASRNPEVAILLGGPAVLRDPGIGTRAGADDIALDGEDAVAKAERARSRQNRRLQGDLPRT